MSFSYSNTPTEWSQPRLRNRVEEDTEDTEEVDDIEEKPEIHKHSKIHLEVNLKMKNFICVTSSFYLAEEN